MCPPGDNVLDVNKEYVVSKLSVYALGLTSSLPSD